MKAKTKKNVFIVSVISIGIIGGLLIPKCQQYVDNLSKDKVHIGQEDYKNIDQYLNEREAEYNRLTTGKKRNNIFIEELGINNETKGEQLISQLLRDYGNKRVTNQTKQDLERMGHTYADTPEKVAKLDYKQRQQQERLQTINSYKHYMIKNYGTKSKPKLTRKQYIVNVLTSEYTKGDTLEADYAVMKLENNSEGDSEKSQSYLVGGFELTPLQVYINTNNIKKDDIAKSIYDAEGKRNKSKEYIFKVKDKYEASYEIKKLNSVLENTKKEREAMKKDPKENIIKFVKALEKQTNSNISPQGYELIEKELAFYLEGYNREYESLRYMEDRKYDNTLYKMIETYGIAIMQQELNIASERNELEQ